MSAWLQLMISASVPSKLCWPALPAVQHQCQWQLLDAVDLSTSSLSVKSASQCWILLLRHVPIKVIFLEEWKIWIRQVPLLFFCLLECHCFSCPVSCVPGDLECFMSPSHFTTLTKIFNLCFPAVPFSAVCSEVCKDVLLALLVTSSKSPELFSCLLPSRLPYYPASSFLRH